jgi:type 1 fimbria pilin
MEYYKNTGIALGFLLLASGAANADVASNQTLPTGTLNISGTITSDSCTVVTPDVVIELPPQDLSVFTAKNTWGSITTVPFNLTGCPVGSTVSLTLAGTMGVNVLSYLPDAAATTATGFNYRIYVGSSTSPIVINSTSTLTPDANGDVISSIGAQLSQSGTSVTAGSVGLTMAYTLAYN